MKYLSRASLLAFILIALRYADTGSPDILVLVALLFFAFAFTFLGDM